jgi:threonylcarbamoyladenosine tRNA methylthiotransferase MtaB
VIRSFSVQNFGCRVNQAEAFLWVDRLRERGLRFEEDPGRSDVVLVNTCTLTAGADRDVRKFVRRTVRERPEARLVLTGCYAEASGEEFRGLSQVLCVVPNKDKDAVPERVLALAERENGERRSAGGDSAEEGLRPSGLRPWRSRAFVKIQDGCDNGCTFCVIPGVRGRSRSAGREGVLARIRELSGRGYREIVLAGIHLSAYGEDMAPKSSLLALLREIEAIPGAGRIRLSSLDPRRTAPDLVAHIAGNPKICQHFHLSLQHVSGSVLKRMGRPAPEGLSEKLLNDFRSLSPAASLGADFIVGFPGEGDDEFEELRGFLERSPLTYFHVFSYSPRPGTPAAGMARPSETVRKARSAALRALSAEKNFRFRRSFVGRDLEAVVIRRGAGRRGKTEVSELLTDNSIKVVVRGETDSAGDLARVRIVRALPRSTEGDVIHPGPGGSP